MGWWIMITSLKLTLWNILIGKINKNLQKSAYSRSITPMWEKKSEQLKYRISLNILLSSKYCKNLNQQTYISVGEKNIHGIYIEDIATIRSIFLCLCTEEWSWTAKIYDSFYLFDIWCMVFYWYVQYAFQGLFWACDN